MAVGPCGHGAGGGCCATVGAGTGCRVWATGQRGGLFRFLGQALHRRKLGVVETQGVVRHAIPWHGPFARAADAFPV